MICAKLNAILLQVFFVCIFARQQDSTPLLIQLILEYLDGCYATMYVYDDADARVHTNDEVGQETELEGKC